MDKEVTLKRKVLGPKGIRKKVSRGLYKLIGELVESSKEKRFYENVNFQNKVVAYNAYLKLAEENGMSREKYQNYFANEF
jgi:hypothetical protein